MNKIIYPITTNEDLDEQNTYIRLFESSFFQHGFYPRSVMGLEKLSWCGAWSEGIDYWPGFIQDLFNE